MRTVLLKATISTASAGLRTAKEDAPWAVRRASNSDQQSEASIQSLRLIGIRISIAKNGGASDF